MLPLHAAQRKRIGFFTQGALVGTQLNRLLERALFELEQSLVATSYALLVQDTLNGWRRSTTSGGVVCGWDLAIGGRSFKQAKPWV